MCTAYEHMNYYVGFEVLTGVVSSACYLLHAGFLLGLFFYPVDEGEMFPRNFG
jgi:hypothetical protein